MLPEVTQLVPWWSFASKPDCVRLLELPGKGSPVWGRKPRMLRISQSWSSSLISRHQPGRLPEAGGPFLPSASSQPPASLALHSHLCPSSIRSVVTQPPPCECPHLPLLTRTPEAGFGPRFSRDHLTDTCGDPVSTSGHLPTRQPPNPLPGKVALPFRTSCFWKGVDARMKHVLKPAG